MSSRPPEHERDQLETAFTPILRRAWGSIPTSLAVAFVDTEGECIDYVSSVEPYEAKVAAAHMLVLMDQLLASRRKLALGEPMLLEVACEQRELWARRVSEEYMLVALLGTGFDRVQVRSVLAEASREFRDEVGLPAPTWEPLHGVLEVFVRPAVGWDYAPAAYRENGVRVGITDVLGRWTEPGGVGGDELVCFRVRTEEGQELTLVHDPDIDGWLSRL